MNGFLLVNKEKGYSSNEIVQKIKKKFSLNKVGHLGTLDPDAEGLLIIAINRATKFSNYFLNSDKSYYVEIKLGKSTTTDDVSGEIIEEFEVKCSEDEVKKEINNFLGKSFQKPPFFSALKYKGKPLYKYARKGEYINKEPRKIEIKEIKNISYKDKICSFQLLCSKGTYIRSIARDLGENLGCGGYMVYLKRLSQHKFNVHDAHIIEELSLENTIKIDDCFKDYEKLSLSEEDLKIFLNGGKVFLNKNISKDLRIYSEDNDFIGLGRLENSYLKHKQLV
jgi:tRNA pseudouridine55 synthase